MIGLSVLLVCLVLLGFDVWQVFQDWTKTDAKAKKWLFVLIPLASAIWFCLHQFIFGW